LTIKSTYMLLIGALLLSGCNGITAKTPTPQPVQQANPPAQETPAPAAQAPGAKADPAPATPAPTTPAPQPDPVPKDGRNAPQAEGVAAEPNSLAVLVNKQFSLPEGYKPPGLIDDPALPFLSGEKGEKRLIRKEAADMLKKMFAAAAGDGLQLAVVSAYRSNRTQKTLFEYYVRTYGEAEARRFSAVPGHSEHETGLAVDVSGRDGKCAAEDCFAGSKEANWLAANAAAYGFIVRYPQGKESITGYTYEPWHLRYVGVKMAQEVTGKGLTLEEYFGKVPVVKQ